VELVSVFESFFTHANAALPDWLQRPLGLILFTANAHVIHHSVDIRRQNSNFGDIFPWWDRLFGTYHPPLAADEKQFVIGLDEFQSGPSLGFVPILKLPFAGKSEALANSEVQQSL
jgi:sterol desaturase/sphingolipid hydroxylase (fatty acid hydroxylase superfamily)